MRRVVALILVLAVSTFGCFPKDAHKRTLAEVAEGGTIVAGVALEGLLASGADCDQMSRVGTVTVDQSCHDRATMFGDIGVALMLAGLLGFVATISTAEDEKPTPKIDIKAEAPAEKQDLKLPPGVTPQQVATPPAPEAPAAAGSDTTPATN